MLRIAALATCLAAPCYAQDVAVGDVFPDLTPLAASSLTYFEYFGEGRPRLNIVVAPNDDFNLDVTIEDTGFLDDSVEGQRTVYTVTYTAEGWEVLAIASEVRCRRGDNRDWQMGPCP